MAVLEASGKQWYTGQSAISMRNALLFFVSLAMLPLPDKKALPAAICMTLIVRSQITATPHMRSKIVKLYCTAVCSIQGH